MNFSWASKAVNTLLPLHCRLCQAEVDAHPAICTSCKRDLPWLDSVCSVCSIALPAGSSGPCGDCQSNPKAYRQATALFDYAAPLDRLITEMKFGQQLGAARLLGELMADGLAGKKCVGQGWSILPVPLHPQRLRQRGYNQSLELARPLARQLGLPLLTTLVSRIQPTRAQTGLSANARVANLRGAFALNQAKIPARVLLIDDVITTGATINELAKTLTKAGVEQIEVAAIARAS